MSAFDKIVRKGDFMGGAVQFIAGQEASVPELANGLVVAVDLGFSKKNKSTGVAWQRERGGESDSDCFTFAEARKEVCEQFKNAPEGSLIVEAPLWGKFNKDGNPDHRTFEQSSKGHRGWYYSAGAVTCLAALWLLQGIEKSATVPRIYVYEGLLTFKKGSTNHREDAEKLRDAFLHGTGQFHAPQLGEGETAVGLLDLLGEALLSEKARCPAVLEP